jgi:hypothetical protein
VFRSAARVSVPDRSERQAGLIDSASDIEERALNPMSPKLNYVVA